MISTYVKRSIREEPDELKGSSPVLKRGLGGDSLSYFNGTPLLIAGLMCFMILRFLGLGFNNTSLYLLGGMITVAVGIVRLMIYSLPRQSGRLGR